VVNAFGQRFRKSLPRFALGLARALSKLGFCSRTQAQALVHARRVRVNGTIQADPQWPVDFEKDRLEVDGLHIRRASKIYIMLNKPRGLITTTSDEKGRPTVFKCFGDAPGPFVTPVGRLDKASEGMLLFTNDSKWSWRITDPATHLEKTYHVQVSGVIEDTATRQIQLGTKIDEDFLAAKSVAVLRRGTRTTWLEVVLDEGKNRHIRRLLAANGIEVLRLVRIAIGAVVLGDLPKGQFRHLTKSEIDLLS
jgi:23S rRNA pseudouridine2605 synthase